MLSGKLKSKISLSQVIYNTERDGAFTFGRALCLFPNIARFANTPETILFEISDKLVSPVSNLQTQRSFAENPIVNTSVKIPIPGGGRCIKIMICRVF